MLRAGSIRGGRLAALSLAALVAAACGTLTGGQRHQAASVVGYLYPEKAEPVQPVGVPVLSLPMRVGIAFVPSEPAARWHATPLPEQTRVALLKEVASHFERQPFVAGIDVIPTAYLRPKGGFENLDQVTRLFNVETVALVSYDQAQFTDEGLLSLSYWTLVGAYVVRGERNDTSTLLDAAVFHVPSRQMLFRAPGTSRVKGSATPVNLQEQLRRDSEQGFREATRELITNLDTELAAFEERVKRQPERYQVVRKPGYTGAGAAGPSLALAALAAAGAALLAGRHQP